MLNHIFLHRVWSEFFILPKVLQVSISANQDPLIHLLLWTISSFRVLGTSVQATAPLTYLRILFLFFWHLLKNIIWAIKELVLLSGQRLVNVYNIFSLAVILSNILGSYVPLLLYNRFAMYFSLSNPSSFYLFESAILQA